MSAETELLWPGVALLLLLGAVASLCVRCSRSGSGGTGTGRGWEEWRQYTQKLSQARPACVWEGQSEKPHKMGLTPPRAGPNLHLNTVRFTGGFGFAGSRGMSGAGRCSGQGRKGWAGCLGHRLLCPLLSYINSGKRHVMSGGPCVLSQDRAQADRMRGPWVSVPPWLWTFANLVPFLQVRSDRRKFMSRGTCECLCVPGPVTLCAGLWASPQASCVLCLTPLPTPPPGWAPVGPEQLGKERGHPGAAQALPQLRQQGLHGEGLLRSPWPESICRDPPCEPGPGHLLCGSGWVSTEEFGLLVQ